MATVLTEPTALPELPELPDETSGADDAATPWDRDVLAHYPPPWEAEILEATGELVVTDDNGQVVLSFGAGDETSPADRLMASALAQLPILLYTTGVVASQLEAAYIKRGWDYARQSEFEQSTANESIEVTIPINGPNAETVITGYYAASGLADVFTPIAGSAAEAAEPAAPEE